MFKDLLSPSRKSGRLFSAFTLLAPLVSLNAGCDCSVFPHALPSHARNMTGEGHWWHGRDGLDLVDKNQSSVTKCTACGYVSERTRTFIGGAGAAG